MVRSSWSSTSCRIPLTGCSADPLPLPVPLLILSLGLVALLYGRKRWVLGGCLFALSCSTITALVNPYVPLDSFW
jgi:hypothetical protein